LRLGFSGTATTVVETETPGFTTYYLRGYYNVVQSDVRRLNLVGGIDNLFDKTYLEHLDLRLQAQNGFAQTSVLSPGITPFMGVELTY
jgi:outer membrane receptor protein involved in Fe transport